MILLTLELETLEFDPDSFIITMAERLKEQMRIAGQKFYAAAIKKIPVRTGFVAGAFNNLAEAVGARKLKLPDINIISNILRNPHLNPNKKGQEELSNISKKQILETFRKALSNFKETKPGVTKPGRRIERHDRTIKTDEYYRPSKDIKILKTPQSGRQFATKVEDVLKEKGPNIYKFVWGVDITYFRIQDLFAGNSPTSPWKAMEYGEKAFQDYLFNKSRLRDLFVDVTTFYTKRTYKVKGKNLSISTSKIDTIRT